MSSALLGAATADRNGPLFFAIEAYRRRDFSGAIRHWDAAAIEPATHTETLLTAHSLAQLGDERCQAGADAVARFSPIESALTRAICEANRPGGGPVGCSTAV